MQNPKRQQNPTPYGRATTLALALAAVMGLSACASMETDAGYYRRLNAVHALNQGLQQNGWDRTAANPNTLPMARPQPVQAPQPCTNPYTCPMQYYGR